MVKSKKTEKRKVYASGWFWAIVAICIFILSLVIPFIQEYKDTRSYNLKEIENIRIEIEKANYCEINEDCRIISGRCPIGCYISVNKEEAERIDYLIRSIDSSCVYECMAPKEVVCFEKKCKINFEQ